MLEVIEYLRIAFVFAIGLLIWYAIVALLSGSRKRSSDRERDAADLEKGKSMRTTSTAPHKDGTFEA